MDLLGKVRFCRLQPAVTGARPAWPLPGRPGQPPACQYGPHCLLRGAEQKWFLWTTAHLWMAADGAEMSAEDAALEWQYLGPASLAPGLPL
ncbi:hypothetical protein BKE38_04160 [Pseudoroseomonas deserti]|uniref:Uncharacterized protein n=1 Tax=Teichococcus deserti TaxID=1817963 RepID=A0A1V2H6S9_9PROT|nr:hypothetical protein [Pseudoroseomonas deserti]ONG57352.1 hypothetical protein BKE38_04160 [Pseudoroseomonas deserti]